MSRYFEISTEFRRAGFMDFGRRNLLRCGQDREDLLKFWNQKSEALLTIAKMGIHTARNQGSTKFCQEDLDEFEFHRLDELKELNLFALRCGGLQSKCLDPRATELLRDFIDKLCSRLGPKTRLSEDLALDLLNNDRGLFDVYRSFAHVQHEALASQGDPPFDADDTTTLIEEDEEYQQNNYTSWFTWFEDFICRCEDEDADHSRWAAAAEAARHHDDSTTSFTTPDLTYVPNLPLTAQTQQQIPTPAKSLPYSDVYLCPTDDGALHRQQQSSFYPTTTSSSSFYNRAFFSTTEPEPVQTAAVLGVVISV